MRADPAHLGLNHIRSAHPGLARPAIHNLCGLQSQVRPAHHLVRGPADSPPPPFFFFNSYDKNFYV